MNDYNLYINFIIRRDNYFKIKNKVEELETELSSLKSLIQTTKNTEIVTHSNNNNDLSSLVAKEEELSKALIDNKNTLELLFDIYKSSLNTIDSLKEIYFNNKRIYKERSMFYIFYYFDFKKSNITTDYVAEKIGITREHLSRLRSEYYNCVTKKVLEQKSLNVTQISHKCYTNIT